MFWEGKMSAWFRTILVFICLVSLFAAPVQPVMASSASHGLVDSLPKDFDCGTVTDIPILECQALVALYNSTNGPGWTNSTNWLASTTAGNWYGVLVLGGHVNGLTLYSNHLVGTLPTEIGNLSFLQNLLLYFNDINGVIPSEIGSLPNLQSLQLMGNELTGPLPSQMAFMTGLRMLRLEHNQLSGSLPAWLGNLSNLQHIGLGDNQFAGSIPTEIGNLTGLISLYLAQNVLSGAVPVSFTNLVNLCLPSSSIWPCNSSAYGLDLGKNYLTTPATPQTLADFLALHDPDWANTQQQVLPYPSCVAVWSIPTAECNALVDFYSATGGPNWMDHTNWLENKDPDSWYGVTVSGGYVINLNFENNHLSGTIPPELGNLNHLQWLYLSGNQLSGAIPSQLGNLTNLYELFLGGNQLSGAIPPEFGNLTNLNWLDLSRNQLSGAIPPELGNLTNLQSLYLYRNQISGAIPPEFGNLANLSSLNLSGNQLSGAIPFQLGNLTNLYGLSLGGNQLSGTIPPELSSLLNLSWLSLNGNQLSGAIPPELGNVTNLQYLYLSDNQLSGAVPVSFTNLVNLCTPTMQYCYDYGLRLDYNRLTVPATPQALVDFLAAFNPGWDLTQAVTETIGAAGGQIISNDGDTTLTFPAGSVPADTVITFVPQPGPSEEIGSLGFANSSFLVEVSASGKFDFDQPVTVSLSYADADLGAAPWLLAENTLILYWWSGSAWVDAITTCPVPADYDRDPAANTLQLSICKSGEFVLLGEYQPTLFLPMVKR